MIIKDFHNVRFPEDVSYGSSGGPGFKTTIIELSSGHEQRNIEWSLARATYDASHGVKTREQMEEILDFFYARRGRAYGFRFKDWMDYKIERQLIGYQQRDNSIDDVQVFKRYEPLTSYAYDRPIVKLVPGTVRLWINDVEASPAAVSQIVDVNTGVLYKAPGGTPIPALDPLPTIEIECEFDVPVRFDTDEIKISHDDWELMSWPSIPLMELKPRSA